MSLIPTISIEELKKVLEEGKLSNLPSCEIIGEDYQATLIVPAMIGGQTIYDHTRTQAEYLGVQGNSVLPPVKEEDNLICPECGFVAKSPVGLRVHTHKHKVKSLV